MAVAAKRELVIVTAPAAADCGGRETYIKFAQGSCPLGVVAAPWEYVRKGIEAKILPLEAVSAS